jgi:hypothetical protein
LATPQYRPAQIIPERLFAVRNRVDLEMPIARTTPNACKYNGFE